MTINFNVEGETRKQLVQALGEILGEKPVYMRAPTYGYTVGAYTVDRYGMVTALDDVPKTREELIAGLAARGFTPADGETAPETEAVSIAETETEAITDVEADAIAEMETDVIAKAEATAAPEGEAPTGAAETPNDAPEAEPAAMPADAAEAPDVAAESPEAAAGNEAPSTLGEHTPSVNENSTVEAAETAPQPIEAEETGVSPVAEAPTKEDGKPPAPEVPANPPAKEDEGLTVSTEVNDIHLTISIPRNSLSDSALERLRQIVSNKESLFKRALSADALSIEATEEAISFPWFTLKGITGEASAYGQFIAALCQMAKEQKRILEKPYDGDNDRFAMRIFMVRMGMKGVEFALARRLMMQNLTGNSGWRFGTPPKKKPEQEKTASEEIIPAADQSAPAVEQEVMQDA